MIKRHRHKLKSHVKGIYFQNDNEVKAEVKKWFRKQPKQFFFDGFKKLISRWCKCIENKGSYVEK